MLEPALINSTPRRAARWLEASLLATFVAHAGAMLAMAILLLPGMPGGPNAAVADRAAYLASQATAWRLGWLAWQLTAASDLALAIALVATPWIPRPPAILALLLTAAALVPDQYGQFSWTWAGVELARHDPAAYAAFETHVMRLVAGWGAIGYLSAAVAWTWAFAAAGTWSASLSRLSVAVWGLFAFCAAGLFWTAQPAWAAAAVSGGNAIAFVLLMTWFALVAEHVLRRSRPVTPYGSGAVWRSPGSGGPARACDVVANSRFVRYAAEWLPTIRTVSDVTDAVSINYLVPAARLADLVPRPLRLQTVGDGRAVLTIVTYNDGTVSSPRAARRLRPSPVRSDWQLYVTDPTTGRSGARFVTTAFTALLHSVATRLLSDGTPMHVPAAASVVAGPGGTVSVRIDPGRGSAPDLEAELHPVAGDPPLPAEWVTAVGNWDGLLAYVLPQGRVLDVQPWYGRVVRREIAVEMSPAGCRRLDGPVRSTFAARWIEGVEPVCFVMERGRLDSVGVAYDPIATGDGGG